MPDFQNVYILGAIALLHATTVMLSLYVVLSASQSNRRQKIQQSLLVVLLPLIGPAIVFGIYRPQDSP